MRIKKMETNRPCGCKGIRTCLICERDFGIKNTKSCMEANDTYVYCPYCNKCWTGWKLSDYTDHPNHKGNSIDYPGIYIKLDFLSKNEENNLLGAIDNMPWDLSQSGRRKQNFGPKCNFKKRKLRCEDFGGFPAPTKFIQEKFKDVDILANFQTIEQCSLEYNPERGASIDPHIDDCWIWGERIVTVNLLADSVLTMTYNDKPARYNLDCVQNYPACLTVNGEVNHSGESYKLKGRMEKLWPIVRVPMPRQSLLVMYNSARYEWEHRVLREDVTSRRICLAYREFTPGYLPGGNKYIEGKPVLEMARNFWNTKKLY